jgi:V/A-type H+-transporting ATPase subunit E
MTASSKLDLLTDKIYQEAISKAEEESAKLLTEARKEAKSVLAKANKEAEVLLQEAKTKAETTTRNTDASIKLASQQLIYRLESEIKKMIVARHVDQPLKTAFSDPAFLHDLIREIVKTWQQGAKLEVVLPEVFQEKAYATFRKELLTELPQLTFSHSTLIPSGFEIIRKDTGYHLSFTHESFLELLRPLLSHSIQQILFE